MSFIYTFNDGALLAFISARQLITYPVWNGNRVLDTKHKDSIKELVKGEYKKLDRLYSLVGITETDAVGNKTEKWYINDGQHRAEVIREAFLSNPTMEDFQVLVTFKRVTNETEAIMDFRILNHAKPIDWKTDRNVIINEYILALVKAFSRETRRTPISFIREETKFPYLSFKVLRTALENEFKREPLSESKESIAQFVERVIEWNVAKITESISSSASKKEQERYEKAIATRFMLAVDPACPWIQACRHAKT
jgi:hypothetical protein